MTRAAHLARYTLLLAALLSPVALRAQSDTASLAGSVRDADGGALPGAMVTVTNTATGATRVATADERGRFVVPLLPPGRYSADVQLQGFRAFRDSGVQLRVGEAVQLDATLPVGNLSEAVEVTGSIPLLDTLSVTQGTVITEEKVHTLPLDGRQFIQLALLVPGANSGGRAVQQNSIRTGQTGGLSISGGRTNNTAFMLDGVTNSDPDYNSLNYSPSIDGIAEFQVQTAMFSAAYGRATGGQVNVVTKSGSSRLRGSAFEFHRNRRFDARPFNLPGELPDFIRNQFGGSLGGPIVRGRLFAFAFYEGLRLTQTAANLRTVAVPSELERQGNSAPRRGASTTPARWWLAFASRFPGDRCPSTASIRWRSPRCWPCRCRTSRAATGST